MRWRGEVQEGVELVVDGGGWRIAGAAVVLSLVLVVGLARQKPWRRAHLAEPATEPTAEPPLFVRFSTWCYTTLLVPNVLHGTLILFRGGEGFDYASAWLIGHCPASSSADSSMPARAQTPGLGPRGDAGSSSPDDPAGPTSP